MLINYGEERRLTKDDEVKISHEGFPLTKDDAKHLLDFIDLFDPHHFFIEPEIVVKLEQKAGEFKQ